MNYLVENEKQEVIVRAYKVEVPVPEIFIRHNITEVEGDVVNTFGIFTFYVYPEEGSSKPIRGVLRIPSLITMLPDKIVERGSGEDKEFVLEFYTGDAFMKSTILPQSTEVVKRFIKLIFSGHVPDEIGYSELANLWEQCNLLNGVNLNVSDVILELIVSEFSRDPSDYSNTFRIALAKKPMLSEFARKMLRVEDIPRYTSTFAALTSADPKQGLTIAVIRTRQHTKSKDSPIENIIK